MTPKTAKTPFPQTKNLNESEAIFKPLTNMLIFYARKENKRSKEFRVKTKFAPISEEERKRLLFDAFDIIFSQKKPKKNKEKEVKNKPKVMHYFTLTPLSKSGKIKVDT